MARDAAQDTQTIAHAAEALLREHPDALVAGLASNGLIVPVPHTVGLWGQELIAGRAVFDQVVAEDRTTVARLWVRLQDEGAVAARVRLLRNPASWTTLHFLDLRDIHGIVLAVVLPAVEDAQSGAEAMRPVAIAPRFCSLIEDEGARVLDCDDAFTEMFGYTAAELIGKSVLDQIHPDDQGRAVEGWLSLLATRRSQQTRLRRRHKDGRWVWVDATLHNYLNERNRNHVLVEIIDASAEMAAQEALQEREELLRQLIDAIPVGLLQLDSERRVLYSNARLLAILQGSAARRPLDAAAAGDSAGRERAPTARSAQALLSGLTDESIAAFDSALGEVLAGRVDRDIEVDVSLPGGGWRRALMSLRVLLRQSGEVSGAITCVLDITDSARARRELELRASLDALTGCHNRSSILTAVEEELARRDASLTGAVYVDLDNFKPVNDRWGHAAGDELLALAGERLRHAARANDLVGRVGGDEFLLLLRELPSAETALSVARRIARELRAPFALAAGTMEIAASIGISCARAGTATADELIRHADAAMYSSKQQGENAPVLARGEA